MNKTVFLLLRIGVAFAFIYPAVSAFITPTNWIGFLPIFLATETFLLLWGIVEIILGLWILSGKKIFIPSLLASLALIGVIVFNFTQIDILFRDVVILLVTISLAINSRPQPKSSEKASV